MITDRRNSSLPPGKPSRRDQIYAAYRPDSQIFFALHPEIGQLWAKWTANNALNNAGDLPRLYAIVFNIKQILSDGIPGDMAELGVYRGNSAAVLAHFARISAKRLVLFDTFTGFDNRDLVGDDQQPVSQFKKTSFDLVRDFVGEQNVRFVQGRFPESISPDLDKTRFCLVHLDCDLYESAKAGLEFFFPRLSPGGLLIVHDYANPWWEGIKRAVDEYFSARIERPVVFGDKSGTAMLRKSAARPAAKAATRDEPPSE